MQADQNISRPTQANLGFDTVQYLVGWRLQLIGLQEERIYWQELAAILIFTARPGMQC